MHIFKCFTILKYTILFIIKNYISIDYKYSHLLYPSYKHTIWTFKCRVLYFNIEVNCSNIKLKIKYVIIICLYFFFFTINPCINFKQVITIPIYILSNLKMTWWNWFIKAEICYIVCLLDTDNTINATIWLSRLIKSYFS